MRGRPTNTRNPVARHYTLEYDVEGLTPRTPSPTAPLREQRKWIEALLFIYPDAKVRLDSRPEKAVVPSMRTLKTVVIRDDLKGREYTKEEE